MANITIIGAGNMGTALCWPLADNHHAVRLVGTPLDDDVIRTIQGTRIHPRLQRELPATVQSFFVNELSQALSGADLVVSGVSSFGVHWLASEAGRYLPPNMPLISVTKGLFVQEDGIMLTVPEATDLWLPEAIRGQIPLHAIGGPCIAQELSARRHTGVMFCGANADRLEWIASLFRNDYYHVNTSTDVTGVEACAALKNAYAMGVNLAFGEHEVKGADGLANHYNPQAALFAQSLNEMRKLVKYLGGDTHHVYALPGAGDLYVTVFAGRTARLGRLLGQGKSYAEARQLLAGETLEAVEIITNASRAIDILEKAGKASWADYPFMQHMNNLLQGVRSEMPWEKFFR